MPKFYRKQQVVEAFQWDGCVDNTLGFPDWMVEAVRTRTAWLTKSEDYGPEIILNNDFVTFIARPGDWIVRDEEGHINRCHAELFTKVYGYDDGRQDKQPDNNKILGNEMSKALERVINEQQVVIDALRKRADMSQQYAIRQTDTIEKACKLLQRFVYCDTSKEAMTDAKLFLSERGWCLMCESFLCEGHDYDG